MSKFDALLPHMQEIADLDAVLGLLSWDEETHAPPGARGARGLQTATVEGLKHQRLTRGELGDMLEAALADPGLSATQRTMLTRFRRTRDLATRVPERLVKALAEARSVSIEAWGQARTTNDFALFEPHLARVVALTRERAQALGSPTDELYDALLDEYEPGATAATLRPVFAELRGALVPLVQAIAEAPRPDTAFLAQRFDEGAQWQFTLQLLTDLGFDMKHGRQDRSAHPFTGSVGQKDVRVTTRIDEQNPFNAIFSTIHECGHGLYEQGFDPEHHRTPLGVAPSMGIHESQSRLWENQVGRSRPFWQHYLPVLKARFPGVVDGVGLEAFYRAVNLVEPSFIRTEADEVTYNLHILLRFELEQALLRGDLPIAELPGAWRAQMKADLGVVPETDAEGCLQDIHWAWGAIGYFPTYTLGNLYAAQLMAAYEAAHPSVWADVAEGRFAPLLEWLRAKIHRRGFTAMAGEIVADAVGAPLQVAPLARYLRAKFEPLYGLT
jgi:carboxypeptidase Taq